MRCLNLYKCEQLAASRLPRVFLRQMTVRASAVMRTATACALLAACVVLKQRVAAALALLADVRRLVRSCSYSCSARVGTGAIRLHAFTISCRLQRAGFAPACGSLRDPIETKTQGHLLRIANVHELRIEKETGCYLDYLYAICA